MRAVVLPLTSKSNDNGCAPQPTGAKMSGILGTRTPEEELFSRRVAYCGCSLYQPQALPRILAEVSRSGCAGVLKSFQNRVFERNRCLGKFPGRTTPEQTVLYVRHAYKEQANWNGLLKRADSYA